MSELLLKLPEDQLPFFLALLERLKFVEVERIDGQRLSKEQFLDDLEAAAKQASKHLAGEMSLKNIKTVLDEL